MKTEWLVIALGLWAFCAAAAVSPLDVGCRAQLFVDRVLVRTSERVAFTLHPAKKHPSSPLVRADRPLDGWRLALCGSVIYDEDEKLFKMWYLGNRTTYATSRDGFVWEKHDTAWRGYMFVSVIKDKADPDPARRYKIIAWSPNAPGVTTAGYDPPIRTGYNTSISPDGKQVTTFSQQTICPHGDVISGYYDRQRRLYVAFPKIMTRIRGHNRRCFAVITSKDFVTWTEPKLCFVPDARDDAGSLARIEEVRPVLDVPDNPRKMRTEFYGIGVYQQESCTVAFPWMLTINNNARYGNHEGPGEVQLAVSRDLEHWERPFRRPCILRGKVGEWDCGFFWTAAEALRVGDEIWLYYAGSNFTHGTPVLYRRAPEGARRERLSKYTSSIGLATWKLDRFVSVDGPAEGGTLTTVPIVFSGNRLELNAATEDDGHVVVELLDASGSVIAVAAPVEGDSLRHVVAWTDGTQVGKLAGKPIALRFHLTDASLYSFAFRK